MITGIFIGLVLSGLLVGGLCIWQFAKWLKNWPFG